jgi:hypothetical protein
LGCRFVVVAMAGIPPFRRLRTGLSCVGETNREGYRTRVSALAAALAAQLDIPSRHYK